MIGKVPPELLSARILTRTGATRGEVLQGPAYGEDTAAIDLGEQILVVNADPLSLAAEQVGTLGVHVACNDVAASGASPQWLTNTMFLPDEDPETIEVITSQVDGAAREIGVAIVGGHAEYAPDLSRPLLVFGAMGVTDRYVGSGGAQPGDAILLSAGAAIEGTAILAADFGDALREGGVCGAVIDRAEAFIDELSVIPAATAVADHATGMHDPTEGGVLAGLVEMAIAADHTFEIDPGAIPIRAETEIVCDAMGVDPLRIFGSGALLVTVDGEAVGPATDAIESVGVDVATIGRVTPGAGEVLLGDQRLADAPSDDLYELWA